ncbi:MAG TPA: hypothetical protein VJ673_11460 [Aromatoleum sp.]|uniref:hypothetical protein n=1 Tax=Aromatoleum sp. TaxID=2307007 RepID=UPI002B487317|nr:hypothetical protein [Aromatoleum sp.]HJV26299.1 hypothetical protein [Aromatoleum sp.]
MSSNAIQECAAELRAEREAKAAGNVASLRVEQKPAPIIQFPSTEVKAPTTALAQLEQIKNEQPRPDAAQRAAQWAQSIATALNAFQDQYGNFNVKLPLGERIEVAPIGSEAVADAIRDIARRESGRVIGNDVIATVCSTLRTGARAKPGEHLFRRVGKDGSDYLIDRGDAGGHCFRVNATGMTIEKNDTIPFRRGRGYGELPVPVVPAAAAQAWGFVAPMVENVSEDDKLAVVAAAVEHLRCDSPNPILAFVGPEGSSKSSVAERLARAVDQFEGDMPSTEQDPRDMIAAAQVRHAVVMDNVTAGLPENLMCRISTGGAVTQREYFTNADALTLPIHAALILTAITPPLRQSDTLDRALIVPVQKPRAYRPEAEVRAEYAAKLPEVLGGLLFFLQESLRVREAVARQRDWKHRMVAWNQTGEAIAQALGHPPGYFVEQMAGKRQCAAADYVEGDTFARSLVKALHVWAGEAKPAEKLPSYRYWHKAPGWCAAEIKGRVFIAASAQAICGAVARQCDEWSSRGPTLPSTARATTGALQRVQGVLGRAGIEASLQPINGAKNSAWVFLLPATGRE